MHITDKAVDLIKKYEGYRSKAYKCPAGVWTIGYGTTKIDGKPVVKGMTCTREQAHEWARVDIARFEPLVMKYDTKYHWTQNEFDALMVFTYNIGSIDKLTINGTRTKAQIAEKILAYDKARVNGVLTQLPGLVARRKAEQKLFLTK